MKYLLILVMSSFMITSCTDSAQSESQKRSNDPQAVIGRTWQWHGTITPMEKITVSQPERYTFRLTEQGKAEVQFDCNRGGGTYQISDGQLSFGPLMSTRKACPEDTMDVIFMKNLQNIHSFFTEGDTLYLELPYDSGTVQFKQP